MNLSQKETKTFWELVKATEENCGFLVIQGNVNRLNGPWTANSIKNLANKKLINVKTVHTTGWSGYRDTYSGSWVYITISKLGEQWMAGEI